MRWFLILIVAFPGVLLAEIPDVYHEIGGKHSVPPQLLYAVAKTESSKSGETHPWPWTANVDGKAKYFESRLELYEYLLGLVQDEDFGFDVGIMQINWNWNADLFAGDLWAATDPYINVDAGASFLSDLRNKSGSFNTAVALYHVGSMNTPDRKKRAIEYCLRVKSFISQLSVATNE